MDVRAAVAHAAGAPLVIETVQLDGPKAGEVLVEIKATGICHTDEFTRWSRGHHGKKRRPRHTAVHPRVPPVQVMPVAQDQSVHGHSCHAGQGRNA